MQYTALNCELSCYDDKFIYKYKYKYKYKYINKNKCNKYKWGLNQANAPVPPTSLNCTAFN